MAFQSDQPYNDLPLLPPAQEAWETLAVYKILAEARAAMAELKGRMPIIPNPLCSSILWCCRKRRSPHPLRIFSLPQINSTKPLLQQPLKLIYKLKKYYAT